MGVSANKGAPHSLACRFRRYWVIFPQPVSLWRWPVDSFALVWAVFSDTVSFPLVTTFEAFSTGKAAKKSMSHVSRTELRLTTCTKPKRKKRHRQRNDQNHASGVPWKISDFSHRRPMNNLYQSLSLLVWPPTVKKTPLPFTLVGLLPRYANCSPAYLTRGVPIRRIYPSSKWSSQWQYDGYIPHGWMTSCGRGRDSATPECFGRDSQGTMFVRSSELSLFFPELCSFRRVFCFPRFCKIWRQTFEPWDFLFRRCLGALFENCAPSLGIFLRTPTTTTSIFWKFSLFFQSRVGVTCLTAMLIPRLMMEKGFPVKFHSDGGPQFASREFS